MKRKSYLIILMKIELPWPENPGNTARDIRNHWTAVLTLLGLISSVYHDLPHQTKPIM